MATIKRPTQKIPGARSLNRATLASRRGTFRSGLTPFGGADTDLSAYQIGAAPEPTPGFLPRDPQSSGAHPVAWTGDPEGDPNRYDPEGDPNRYWPEGDPNRYWNDKLALLNAMKPGENVSRLFPVGGRVRNRTTDPRDSSPEANATAEQYRALALSRYPGEEQTPIDVMQGMTAAGTKQFVAYLHGLLKRGEVNPDLPAISTPERIRALIESVPGGGGWVPEPAAQPKPLPLPKPKPTVKK